MTPADFRRIALSLPGATEGSHMDHGDFRVGGKIFATLGYPDEHHGMVRVTPAQQKELAGAKGSAFEPVKGGWGLRGATLVHLATVREADLVAALTLAWRNLSPVSKLSALVLLEIGERFPGAAGKKVCSALDSANIPLLPEPGRYRDRIHLGILKVAECDMGRFLETLKLAEQDWRDVLCAAGLEHANWPDVLKRAGFRVP